MLKNYSKWLKAATLALMLGMSPQLMAQAVIFPQEKQPGVALVENVGDVYTIKNDLLTATFKKADGKISFEGCEAMGLMRSDDIFFIQVGQANNAKTVTSSQMTLGEVTVETLDAKADAATGSFRLPGKAIKAVYTYSDAKGKALTIVWRAILRDGSHYLRTKMDITAEKDVKMYTMVPLKVDVDNTSSEKVPAVVGNTRGAMVMSDKIFAGLESPMGLNTVQSEGAAMDMGEFNPKGWNDQSFKWKPGAETPQAILDHGTVNVPGTKLSADQVVCARGFVKFYEAGEQTITFQYKSGNHRLNLVGVDLLNEKNEVVASDYHTGFTGGEKKNNVYTLNVPKADCYQVRYFVEIKSESVLSDGTITYSKRIAPVKVIYDGKVNASMLTAEKSGRALSANTIGENESVYEKWTKATWTDMKGKAPQAVYDKGWKDNNLQTLDREITFTSTGELNVLFEYAKGNHRLDIAGVFLMSKDGKDMIAGDSHVGFTGTPSKENLYKVPVASAGTYVLRIFVGKENNDSEGKFTVSLPKVYEMHLPAAEKSTIQCMWRRDVELKKGLTWEVAGVVGLVAKDQPRRSVLCYVERERAVPWHANPIYVSWYELNIDRNNDRNYDGNMHDYQCVEVLKQWQKNFYEPFGNGIGTFVWDDGWDTYGTWEFNKNFPNGFSEIDKLARQMDAGIGAWLGPVGGYGTSGGYRREYWNGKGGMQLSNPAYYDVFYKACKNLMKDQGYDYRFFKFDGISAQWSSVGPDAGTKGEENAEGIIYAELDMRKINPYIFFNTSVGTWASPFWFRITDAVWRQENDYGTIGNNKSDRENWITYRDRLVYQNFVQNSPVCPINCLMTHGFILSKHGAVSKNMDYDGIVREMRCAFACGSGMVELYNDFELMNNIKDKNGKAGALWEELSKCVAWQKKNENVLPDAHWVGGNPWTGSKAEVYGWASWNGKEATLAIRNGANEAQEFKTTLRKALEIPAYVKGSITLNKGFEDQADLKGLAHGTAIDIDTELTLTLPGSSVYVFDNTVAKPIEDFQVTELKQLNSRTGYSLQTLNKNLMVNNAADTYVGATDQTSTKAENEQFAFLRDINTPEGQYFMYAMQAKKFVTPEGNKLAYTDEPEAFVTVSKVAEKDNQHMVLKFGDKYVTLSKTGVQLVEGTVNNDNTFVIMGINHQARLIDAKAKVQEYYKFLRISREGWTVTASSSSAAGAAENVLDNKPATVWEANHAEGNGDKKFPYSLTFNLGAAKDFNGFGVQPRQNAEEGRVKSYVIEISNDNKTWTAVQSGAIKYEGNKVAWTALAKTCNAQYVRFSMHSNHQGDALASVAEFFLSFDGTKSAEALINLPAFSVEETPAWYPVYFRNGGAALEDKGAGKKMMTAVKNVSLDAQNWMFEGNETSFVMKSKKGNYVRFNGERFVTVADKAEASEMVFVQSGRYFLELQVKGSSKCMNQFGAAGAGKELGEWNKGDGGNVLQMFPIDIPKPEMPVFSTENNAVYYRIQFATGKNVIADKGVGKAVRLAAMKEGDKSQEWRLVGDAGNFQIVNADNHYLVVADKADTEANAKNGNPVSVSTEKYADGFRLVETGNLDLAPAWEIQSNNKKFNGKAFNQFGGSGVGNTIGFWNNGDVNNPLQFVALSTAIGDVIVGDVKGAAVYTLAGVRVASDVENLPKGLYIVNGKKFFVK